MADVLPGGKGKNTIYFVTCNNIPVGRTLTYSRIMFNVKPQKEDTIIGRLTLGGNIIEYTGKVTTKTADTTTFKIHINSMISTRGKRYTGWDIENYYL